MLFGGDRKALRGYLVSVWQRHSAGEALEPLERLIAGVIAGHPEYHGELEDTRLDRDFPAQVGETNPFLHLAMHIAILEQVQADRPAGILAIYQQLCRHRGEAHRAEHEMMEVLGETLWEAQRHGVPPDEGRYLRRLARLSRLS